MALDWFVLFHKAHRRSSSFNIPLLLLSLTHFFPPHTIQTEQMKGIHERLFLPPPSPPSTELFIVGDVHGCVKELETMVDMIKRHTTTLEPPLIFMVGDLVNKGPSSVDTIRYCRENNIRTVIGNHDLAALNRVDDEDDKEGTKYEWLQYLDAADIEYLRKAPWSISIWSSMGDPPFPLLTIVHAGLVPGKSLEDQTLKDLTEVRLIRPVGGGGWKAFYPPKNGPPQDGDAPSPSPSPSDLKSWNEVYSSTSPAQPLIVYGHDAKIGFKQTSNTVGLDSGCCYGNCLTAVKVSLASSSILDLSFFKVDAERVYSQPGKTFSEIT